MLQLPTSTTRRLRESPVSVAFNKVIRKEKAAQAAFTAKADHGTLPTAKKSERDAYRRYKRLQKVSDDAVSAILSMPAATPEDMLAKIAAAGILVDRADGPKHTLFGLSNWQPDLSGSICDDAAAKLLVSLRSDIRQLLMRD